MKTLPKSLPQTSLRFWYWLIAVVSAAVLVAFVYTAVQQNYRQAANDPQVQYVEDLTKALDEGAASAEALGGGNMVDPRSSLAPFLIVAGEDKKVVTSTIQIDGNTPGLPEHVLEAAKKGQQRVTWKPHKDASIALVVQQFKGEKPGFLLVGRSMKETDKRVGQLLYFSIATWAILTALITLAFLIRPKNKSADSDSLSTRASVPAEVDTVEATLATADEKSSTKDAKKPTKTAKKKTSTKKSKKAE